MDPTTVSTWVQTIGNAIDALTARGLMVYMLLAALVLSTMAGVKALDRAAYARAKKSKRGANPKHNGYLVAVYPLLAILVGGLWAVVGWLAVRLFGTVGNALWSGLITGAATASAFKVVTSLRAFGKRS
jgi:hypothetical protein